MTRRLIERTFWVFVPKGKNLNIVLVDDMAVRELKLAADAVRRPTLICSFQKGEPTEAMRNILEKMLEDERVCYARLPLITDAAMVPIRDIWDGRAPRHTIERAIFLSEIKKKSLSEIVGDKTIPGVFCDVNNTLLRGDVAKPGAHRRLKKIAGERDITLWTMDNLQSVRIKLAEAGISYPVVDKRKLAGCTVELAIDDIPAEKLRKHFLIGTGQFVHVPFGI